MVFKGRFFSSSKKYSDSSSPDGSNSPKTPTSASTSDSTFTRSDKKKVKSDSSPFRRSLAKQKDKDKEKEKEKAKEKEKEKEKEKLKEKEKDWRRREGFGSTSKPSFPSSAPAKLRKGGAGEEGAKEGGSAKLSPILASSLGLNRIKTRSGPLPQETGSRMSALGSSNLGRDCSAASSSSSSSSPWTSMATGRGSGKKKDARGLEKVPEAHASSWAAGRGGDRGKEWSASSKTKLGKQVGSADSPASAQSGNSRNNSEGAKGSAGSISEAETPYDACDTPKESESPRFKAILQATSAPRKKFPADIKSFSHELNSKGVRPFPFWKPRGLYNSKIVELADIARCIANAAVDDERSLSYLISCLEDLQEVVNRRKLDALTVQTFGTRIEKLHQEKCVQLCSAVDVEKVDATGNSMDEEEDVVRSLRTSPVHPITNDRTTIDDFEIIKPISRGAFGRVFLAKKRKTGDLFAIKVLKKADTIRKNAVESILAERDILISVRNPFVVRFFYSFTSRDNLYLVMEYLNGGDLYSLLRNLGCLDEEVARVYIAEVVLALEYLHSLRVVHRDLKPDNLLIAHDGHIKLTDFGLSKVGLINSTDDLSGPAVSGTSLLGEDEPQVSVSEHLNQRERRKKRSAVGTPDYLAPEILLGTGHGTSADWWSVGVILFELIVGIPPFNAEHPQTIFDNILNRKIPWPGVPEEMSFEAFDLINRLLTEDPHQRLGARGASEVKQHVFFKNISWDTLARQKAAFVPAFDSALDTSYFTSRYSWNPSDEFINEASEYEDSSDNGSISGGSSCISNRHEEPGDTCDGLAEIDSDTSVNYSFSNFSFKNLSQLASINYDLLSKGWKEEVPPKSNS